jgi:hypothetical protein
VVSTTIQNGKFRRTRKFFLDIEKDYFFDTYDNSPADDTISREESEFVPGYDTREY